MLVELVEAGHVMDVDGMKRMHLLIWEHAAKCVEVCTFIIDLHGFSTALAVTHEHNYVLMYCVM